ncbi:GNAT family N-acetyltransferase [Legionella sp. 27cVA30]|nr:GNAT family N-acetyltransferase [Legionella sp. 27cVA30]MCP0913763.1 GNAT family N-acetyltransferase [Legionella sp. 27cVA30]
MARHPHFTLRAADLESIVELFKDTVHGVNANDYTLEQLAAWAPQHIHHTQARWQSLLGNIALAAEIDGLLVGFADLTHHGYLDRLFVHKNYLRQGIAARLVKQLEQQAMAHELKELQQKQALLPNHFSSTAGTECLMPKTKMWMASHF